MEFFGIGPLEIILILVVALIAIGPGKLPQFARNLSKGINAFRKTITDVTAEVTSGLEDEAIEGKQLSVQQNGEIENDETRDNPDRNRQGIWK